MKKYFALAAACLLLLAAGCGNNDDITIISETTTSISQMTADDIEAIAPLNVDVTIPFTFPSTADAIDVSDGTEVMAADAYNPSVADILGADKIIQCKDYDVYYFTSYETPPTFLDLYDGDEECLVYYINNILSRVTSSTRSWYFDENGNFDFLVLMHTTESGGFYTFYDTDGSKAFYRMGSDYFGADNTMLDSSEIEEITARYGNAAEFSYDADS